MKKLLLSSLVLLSAIALQATKETRHIRKITLAALTDPAELQTKVNVEEETLEFYQEYGDEDILTTLQLKKITKAFKHRMNRKSVVRFKNGRDLPKDRVALSRKHKKDIVNARNAALDAITEDDPKKLQTACQSLHEREADWYGSQDYV